MTLCYCSQQVWLLRTTMPVVCVLSRTHIGNPMVCCKGYLYWTGHFNLLDVASTETEHYGQKGGQLLRRREGARAIFCALYVWLQSHSDYQHVSSRENFLKDVRERFLRCEVCSLHIKQHEQSWWRLSDYRRILTPIWLLKMPVRDDFCSVHVAGTFENSKLEKWRP